MSVHFGHLYSPGLPYEQTTGIEHVPNVQCSRSQNPGLHKRLSIQQPPAVQSLSDAALRPSLPLPIVLCATTIAEPRSQVNGATQPRTNRILQDLPERVSCSIIIVDWRRRGRVLDPPRPGRVLQRRQRLGGVGGRGRHTRHHARVRVPAQRVLRRRIQHKNMGVLQGWCNR